GRVLGTNELSIASLICGCAQFLVWPLALFVAIGAVVTGHIARRQIGRTGERGAGMARAGLILGYVGIVLSLLALTGILLFVFAFAPGIAQRGAQHDAQAFGFEVVADANQVGTTPRQADLIQVEYQRAYDDSPGCCAGDHFELADGTPLLGARTDDLERN